LIRVHTATGITTGKFNRLGATTRTRGKEGKQQKKELTKTKARCLGPGESVAHLKGKKDDAKTLMMKRRKKKGKSWRGSHKGRLQRRKGIVKKKGILQTMKHGYTSTGSRGESTEKMRVAETD